MKTIRFFVTMVLFGIAMGMSAQVPVSPSELKIKASKDAIKEAKRMKKEGWMPAPGTLPIERQLDRSYGMEYADLDLNMESKFAFGDGKSIGQFYDAAKVSAAATAMGDLVSKLHTEITREVTAQVINKQLPEDQANSIAAAVERSKQLTVQRLSGIVPVLQLYRKDKKTNNTEVMIRYSYLRSKAKNDTYEYLNAEAKKEGFELGMAIQ